MATERATELEDDKRDQISEAGKTVVKVAASTVVASALVGALQEPPRTELMTLPEPTPIVQQYVAFDEDPVDDEDDTQEESESRLKRILRLLKYLIVTLALVGGILFGALKGCAGILAAPMAPGDEEQQESTQTQQPAEDERGVAY